MTPAPTGSLLQRSQAFIDAHAHDDVARLSLKLAGRTDIDVPFVLRQIDGRQRMTHKVPAWAAEPRLLYPARLPLEQCSGETAARYKRELVQTLLPHPDDRRALLDMTGGLGVDFSFMAPLFVQSCYVERQPELCRLAAHNFSVLGVEGCRIVQADGPAFAAECPERAFSLIFADPARRNAAGHKVAALADCEPDVARLLPLLMTRTRYLMLKLSPMLDVSRAISELPGTRQVHILSVGGECKELLLVVGQDTPDDVSYVATGDDFRFAFSRQEEHTATPVWADSPATYLYEPDAAVMKAGAFRALCPRYGVCALHPNSHLYTASAWVPDFPGRRFKVEFTCGFSKTELRRLRGLERANLTTRNFPDTVANLRRRLHLREGGTHYVFATTLRSGAKALIACRRTDAGGAPV